MYIDEFLIELFSLHINNRSTLSLSLSFSLSLSHSLILSLSDDHYRDVFSQAIDEWSTHTCLQFQLASSPQQDHIMFVKDDQLG